MEKFDISKGVSGLFLPVDDNISQWTSLYNTRMHYRMIADQQRQQTNRLKGDAMVKEIDKLLAFSANPMFDGSADNKAINDIIGKYRDSIIDIKSRLLGGDMGALEEGANILSQFSKDLDPNSNAIKSFGKQSYIVGKIDSMRKQLSDTNLFTLDAATQYNSKINDLINQYNTGKIDVDKLTQEINNIDNRNFRSLNKYSEAAKNISQEEWDSLSADGKWKYNTKSINENKAMSLLLDGVNYVGGKDMDLFNFYKVTKNSKGEDVYELISDDEYNKIQEANKNATDDKQKVKTDTRLKTNIRECATIACRRVLGEIYPVMKGTSRTQAETKQFESQIRQDEYAANKNVDKEYKLWEEQLSAKKANINILMKQLENPNLTQEKINALKIKLGIEQQKFFELLKGNKAIQIEPVASSNNTSDKEIEDWINQGKKTGNPVIDDIIEEQRKRGTLLVNINDEKGTFDSVIDHIMEYDKDLYDKLNVNGKGKDAIKLVLSEGIKELKKRNTKGNNGVVNYTEVLQAGYKANINNLIYDQKTIDEQSKLYDETYAEYGVSPVQLTWNDIGSTLKKRNQDDLNKTKNRINALSSNKKGTENIAFTVLSNQSSDGIIMQKMLSNGGLFISTSTVEGDKPITLKDNTVEGVTQFGVNKFHQPVFKVQYSDKDGNIKSDTFVYKGMDGDNFINSIYSFEKTSEESFPTEKKINDYGDRKNYNYEQNKVLSMLNQGVKDVITDYNGDRANNSKYYKNNDNNKDYSYDINYGNNTIKVTILKDANGNLTNKYTASIVINGVVMPIKLDTNMKIAHRNKLIYDNILTTKGYQNLQKKLKNNTYAK